MFRRDYTRNEEYGVRRVVISNGIVEKFKTKYIITHDKKGKVFKQLNTLITITNKELHVINLLLKYNPS